MAFTSDTEVKAEVANSIHLEAASMDDTWDEIITSSRLAAYRQIVGHFLGLGFTKTQIDEWDRGADFELHLAQYAVLIKHNSQAQEVGEWRVELDYWRQLLAETAVLEEDGEPQEPSSSTARISRGTLKVTNDMFVRDSNDSRIGKISKF